MRTGQELAEVDHVIFGCVSQVAEQTLNVARNIVLDAELPIEVPATAVDFQCGSSQQSIHLAAAMVSSGQADIVIAGHFWCGKYDACAHGLEPGQWRRITVYGQYHGDP